MNVEVSQQEGRIHVAGDMTVYSAVAVKDALLPLAVREQRAIELDLSQVTGMDTAGLQILLLLGRVARTNGIDFRVLNPAEVVSHVLNLCGLSDLVCQLDSGEVAS